MYYYVWSTGIDQTFFIRLAKYIAEPVLIMDEAKLEQNLEENSKEYLPKSIVIEIFVCVLKEALDQLFILKNIHSWPETQSSVDKYMTLEERFSEKGNTENLNSTVENALVPKNCAFIEYLLSNLFKELKNKQSYDGFSKTIEIIKRMKADEEKLLVETLGKEDEVRILQNMFQEEKSYYIDKIMECMENTGRIKDKIEDYCLESEIKLDYIRSWENSKIEMKDLRSTQKHQKIQDKIRTVDIDINKEVRVHQEISFAFNLIEKDFDATIAKWKNKYYQDLKTMNEKVGYLQEKQDKQLKEMSKQKELYAKRQKEIDDYKQYKIEQKQMRMEMEKRNKAATIIESWWRGTMVRKGFGKYRKKKEKKGKKKSSEKKSAKQDQV